MLRFLAFLLAACSTLAADDIQMSVPGDSIANACRLFASGDLYCWGDGTVTGGTPLWTSTSSVTAEKVLTGVSAVAVGGGEDSGSLFVCAIMSTDQTVKCWGNNNKGQLGDGTTTDSSAPVTVTDITTATDVVLGYDHTCAVLMDGTAKCWGDNSAGELGDGTTIDSTTPVGVIFLMPPPLSIPSPPPAAWLDLMNCIVPTNKSEISATSCAGCLLENKIFPPISYCNYNPPLRIGLRRCSIPPKYSNISSGKYNSAICFFSHDIPHCFEIIPSI